MEPATDGKSLEKRLKVAALAWGCTLTPATGCVPEPPSPDDCSVIRRWQEGKANIMKEKEGNVRYVNR